MNLIEVVREYKYCKRELWPHNKYVVIDNEHTLQCIGGFSLRDVDITADDWTGTKARSVKEALHDGFTATRPEWPPDRYVKAHVGDIIYRIVFGDIVEEDAWIYVIHEKGREMEILSESELEEGIWIW